LKKYIAGLFKDLPLEFFETESVGRLQEKFGAGINAKVEIVRTIIAQIIPQIFIWLVALPILFRIDTKLTLIGISGMPIFVVLRYFQIKNTRHFHKKGRQYSEQTGAIANELFHNIKVLKSFNKTSYQISAFNKFTDREYKNSVKGNSIREKFQFFAELSINIPTLIVTGMAGFMAIRGEITPGDILLFSNYISRIYDPLRTISWALDKIERSFVSAERLDEILKIESEFANDTDIKIGKARGLLELKNVKFSYENKPVIRGISCKIAEGSTVALIGPSGVGKSTIIKLLLRFRDPDSGQILIDGKDIKEVCRKSIRDNIGLVFQDTLLFNSTILSNIRFGKKNAKLEKVIEAAKKANAHDFIMKLPKGYKTVVGERGVKLSGGEQQRINLARAILKNPPILILDEATSSLDSESEMLVQDALWKLIKGRTTIIIAHRLSTVMKADKILVLNKGKIVEEGTHQKLIEEDGLYAKLFKIQSGAMLFTDKEEEEREEALEGLATEAV